MRFVAHISFITFAIVLGVATARSQDAEPQQAQSSMDDMMKMAQQMAAPGEQHKLLAKLAGNWKFTGKFFMPGQPPMEFAGRSENKLILGDRFLQVNGFSESQNPSLKVQSMTVYGFDKRIGKYTAWGIDTWGTYSVSAAGDYDAQTKTITLSGENEEPGMGKIPFKFILKLIDDAHYSLELHMQYPGMGWQKQMEMMHERA